MEIEAYVEKMKSIYSRIIAYIEDSNEENHENLFKLLDDLKIGENRHDIKSILNILIKISENHYRIPNFFLSIGKIFDYLKDGIKQSFSNNEIFDLFKDNKRILLLLFELKIIYVDESIAAIMSNKKYRQLHYLRYFYPELTNFLSDIILRKTKKHIPSDYEERRKLGENDNIICKIIREDNVDEFKKYVIENNTSLNDIIPYSLYETNPFLINTVTPLIYYAAFFGSIKIFEYLDDHDVEIKPIIWIYAIHSQKLELIKMLEKSDCKPEDITFYKCFEESIKCHHNELANYIYDNLLDKEIDDYHCEPNFYKNQTYYSFYSHNYAFFPQEFTNKYIFYYACFYDYYEIVEYYLEKKKIDVNTTINKIFLKKFFQWNFCSIFTTKFQI